MKRLILLLILMTLAAPACAYSTLHLNSSLVDLGGHTWTNRNSTPYNTSTKVLGSASIQFTKTSYRSIDTPTYSDFNFTTNDFTVDFYFNPQAGGATADNGGVFTLSSGTVRSPLLILENVSTMKAYSSSDGVLWDVIDGASLGTTTANTWAHYAVVRTGNTFRMYQNGVLQSTVTSSASLMDSSTVAWGKRGWEGGDNFVTGLLDEARITPGARWLTSFTPPTTEENYTYLYTNPGTFTFTCPAGMTASTLTLVGGGGSGKSGQDAIYAGSGGYAGTRKTYANLATIPGVGYPITVGPGGSNSSYGSASNAGGASTGMGKTVAGGYGGILLPAGTYNATDGQTGYISLGRISLNGTAQSPFTFGMGGLGFGAGGGGASYDASAPLDTMGGYGASGYASIGNFADYTGNLPNFATNTTSVSYGTAVRFTDESNLTDVTSLSYNWSFGDGTYSSVIGDVVHVYTALGAFDVSLSISSSSGEIIETKVGYITVVSQSSQATWYSPHQVTINVLDLWGHGLPNMRINASYNSSTMPASWITELYGLQSGPAADMVNSTLNMTGTTDDSGSLGFTMLGSLKYDIRISGSGLNDHYVSASPSGSTLNIYVTLPSQSIPGTRNTSVTDLNQTRLYTTQPNTTHLSMCIDYRDTSGRTSYVNESWWFLNNNSVITWVNITNPGTNLMSNCTTMKNTRGERIAWSYNASRSA